LARSARQIDFADDAAADKGRVVRFDDLADEFVARRPGKTVVSALKLDIGVANAAGQQPYQRKPFGPPWPRRPAHAYFVVRQVNGEHLFSRVRIVTSLQVTVGPWDARYPAAVRVRSEHRAVSQQLLGRAL